LKSLEKENNSLKQDLNAKAFKTLNEAKIWENYKEVLKSKLKEIRLENDKLNENLNKYLDLYREVRSQLIEQKMKSKLCPKLIIHSNQQIFEVIMD
jgi:flagellar biosynthesis chaperone FliJ